MAPVAAALLLLFCLRGGGGRRALPLQPSRKPTCQTDIVSQLNCSWPVADASIDCAKEFRLRYRQETQGNFTECIPQHEEDQGRGNSACTCVIPGVWFRDVKYTLLLEENGQEVWNETIYPAYRVRPVPLKLYGPQKEPQSRAYTFTWERSYSKDSPFYSATAEYQLSYWPIDKSEKEKSCQCQSPSCKIFADENELLSGVTYVATMRYRFCDWGKIWSEPSSEVKWVNDFEKQSVVDPWKTIPWLCPLVVALILTCYFCYARVKKQWWEQIPSPAKSKMVENMHPTKLFSVAGKMHSAVEDTCKRSIRNKHGSSLFSQARSGMSSQHGAKHSGFLTPEVPFVERPLIVGSALPLTQPDLHEEEEDEVKVPHEDAVAILFRDLLKGNLSMGGNTSILDPLWQGESLPIADQDSDGVLIEVPVPELELQDWSLGKYDKDTSEVWEMPAELAFQNPAYPPPDLPLDHSLVSSESPPPSPLLAHPSTASTFADGAGPWTTAQDGGGPFVAQAGGYKSFNSLMTNSQVHECQLASCEEGQPWPPCSEVAEVCNSPQLDFQSNSLGEQDTLWFSPCRMSTWLLPPSPEANPEDAFQEAHGKLQDLSGPAVPLVSNYQCFSSALTSRLVP